MTGTRSWNAERTSGKRFCGCGKDDGYAILERGENIGKVVLRVREG